MARLGAHLSAAGGPWRAAAAAGELGCAALQIFLRPPGRWAQTPLVLDAAQQFRDAVARAGLAGACFAHAPYLLNLASADAVLRRRSVDTLVEELDRAAVLGLAGVVLHPGSAGAASRTEAAARCRTAIVEVAERTRAGSARLLLEGTAGMGGQLGTTPAELAELVDPSARGQVGICLDSAHLWGAGYDLLADGWDRVLDELARSWGRPAPDLLHANDTPVALGSRRDRHAPPGEGVLGAAFYRRVLADKRVADVPLILEIPPGPGNELVRAALDRLRSWQPG
jgi:deoxyribonuclease-4